VERLIIMDNTTFYKFLKAPNLIEVEGCKLIFLPPYYPDLNPIEKSQFLLKTKTKTKIKIKKAKEKVKEKRQRIL
jgi:transposase